MLAELFNAIGTGGIGAAFGGVVGAVGKYANQRLEIKKIRMENEHVYKMQKLQIDADKWAAEQKLLITREEGSWGALQEAVKAEGNITGTSQFVSDARGMWRIVLTAILWLLVMVVWAFGSAENPNNDAVMDTLMLTASGASGFWFGAKSVSSQHR